MDAKERNERYVIWEADKLAIPEFPIRLTRVARNPSDDVTLEFTQDEFNKWLLNENPDGE